MKKLIIGISFLFIAQVAAAAPMGNPAELFENDNENAIWIGVEGDYVRDRDLDEETKIEEARAYAMKVNFKPLDFFSVYAILGGMDMEWKDRGVVVDTKTSVLWGGGGSFLLYENSGLRLTIDARYRQSTQDINKITITGAGITLPDSEFRYRDWQGVLAVSKEINWLTVYAGGKYNDVIIDELALSGSTFNDSTNSEEVIGVIAGFSLDPIENFSINFEARYIDEIAASVQIGIQF